ncbi:MAG TPA: autotransporter-associated beta strand repeat-containing protein, partial [Luteolibacter sp.]
AGSVWTNGNDAVFGGAGETIEVDSTVTFRNLTFQTGGYTIADATNNGTLTLTANGTISTAAGTTTISEVIGGSFGLTKTGDGTLLLTGANTYSGTTTLSAGKLTLGYSLISSNVVSSSSNLALAGGKLELSSAAILGLNSQTFNATSLATGTGSQVIMTQNGLGTLSLTLGAITRNSQSAIDFNNPGGTISTSTGSAGSMLRASNGQAYATVNGGADWAAKGTLLNSGNIVTFSSVGSYTANTAGGFSNNANIDIASGVNTTVSADTSVTTLRFNVNQARTVTIGGGNNLTVTGGILVTNQSNASGGTTFTGGSLRAGSTSAELVIHNYGGTGLNIGSAIVDGTGGASSLTLAGTGVTTLTGANTFTGPTAVLGGTLAVNSGAQFGSVTTVNNGAILAGDGTFGGAVSVAGTLSPGATAGTSAGTVTFQNGLALTATGHVSWQLNANSTSGGDMVSVTGGSFTAASGAIVDLGFGGLVNFGDSFWNSARQWTVVDLNGATDGLSGGAMALGTITGGTGSYASKGSFSLLNQSGDQMLAWTPLAVPEPSAALLGGFGVLALLRRRR